MYSKFSNHYIFFKVNEKKSVPFTVWDLNPTILELLQLKEPFTNPTMHNLSPNVTECHKKKKLNQPTVV